MDAFINGICSTINGAPAYLRHHKRQAVTASDVAAPIPQLSFEKTRVSLQEHPFVAKAGIAADKIYRVLLAMLASTETPPPQQSPSFDAPPHFDPMHHGVECERCTAVGMFERKRGSGGHTCVVCGHSNYLDLHRGDPTWHGVDHERSHWEVVPAAGKAKDAEHTAAIERIGFFIYASNDVQERAIHVLRSYRNSNNIASIDVVAAAALILATNTDLVATQTIEIPPRPPVPFACEACNSRWSRKVDARVCCRNGDNYRSTKVRRIHFDMQGPSRRPEFDIDSDDGSHP